MLERARLLEKLSPKEEVSRTLNNFENGSDDLHKIIFAGDVTPHQMYKQLFNTFPKVLLFPQRFYSHPEQNLSQPEINFRVDSFLKEMLENRLSSMMHLRVKMEEIANAQRQEEQQYVQAIKDILKHHLSERDTQNEREKLLTHQLEELEQKYRKEYQDKIKTQQLFASFRDSGNSIIQKMKQALEEVSRSKNSH